MRYKGFWVKAGVVFLLVVGFVLRTWKLEELAGFDYDGEKAAFWIWDLIVDHKLSLIGQEISTGGVFIGPLYYYLLSPFYFLLGMDPIAANVVVSLISTLAMILVYKVGAMLFSRSVGLLALFIYVLSFQINFYDRTTAPSALVMLLALSTIYFLLSKGTLWHYILLGLTLGLTFSVHPTAALLLPMTLSYWRVWKKKVAVKNILAFALALLFLLFPLLAFDLRHGFGNLQNTLRFLGEQSFSPSAYPFIFKAIVNLRTMIVSVGQILLPNFVGAGVALFIILVFLGRGGKSKFLFFWAGLPLLALSFYSRVVPEYYFLLTFPILLIYFSSFLLRLGRLAALLTLALLAVVNIRVLLQYQNPTGLAAKKGVVSYILDDAQDRSFTVGYDADLSQQSGFSYLFRLLGKEPSPTGENHYIIVMPPQRAFAFGPSFGGFKVVKND